MKRKIAIFLSLLLLLAVSIPISAVNKPIDQKLLSENVLKIHRALEKAEGVPFAGLYVDEAKKLHIGIVGNKEEHKKFFANIVDSNIKTVFWDAKHTYKELREAQLKIRKSVESLKQQGIELISWGPDEVNNRLDIKVKRIDNLTVNAITSIVGNNIDVIIKEGEPLENVDRYANYDPLIGGVQVFNMDKLKESTLSFGVLDNNGNKGIVISGHGGYVGERIGQSYSSQVGTVSRNPIQPRHSDAAFVPISSRSIRGKIYSSYYVMGMVYQNSLATGMTVTYSGISSSGSKTISAVRKDISSPDYGTLYDQIEFNSRAYNGDSGAPVFFNDSGSFDCNVIGILSMSGSLTSYASPVEYILSELNLSRLIWYTDGNV